MMMSWDSAEGAFYSHSNIHLLWLNFCHADDEDEDEDADVDEDLPEGKFHSHCNICWLQLTFFADDEDLTDLAKEQPSSKRLADAINIE